MPDLVLSDALLSAVGVSCTDLEGHFFGGDAGGHGFPWRQVICSKSLKSWCGRNESESARA